MTRVIAYIDGLNLYHGLKAKHGRKYHWLDLQRLATSLLRPGQRLMGVRYFTARIRNQPASEQRQDDYLCPVIRVMKEVAPAKRVVAAFPPRRWSDSLRRVADGTFTIGADKIRNSQLPDKIKVEAGLVLERPEYWR